MLCRQAPGEAIADAPADFLSCPAADAQHLGVLKAERRLDQIEWGCISDL